MSANIIDTETLEASLLGRLETVAALIRVHDEGAAISRERRIEILGQARELGISHSKIARALGSTRTLSQQLVARYHDLRQEGAA